MGDFAFIVIARLLRVILMPHAPASEPVLVLMFTRPRQTHANGRYTRSVNT